MDLLGHEGNQANLWVSTYRKIKCDIVYICSYTSQQVSNENIYFVVFLDGINSWFKGCINLCISLCFKRSLIQK